VELARQIKILKGAHNVNGHQGNYTTKSFVSKRFWWPEIKWDAEMYVKTCHLCQEQQKLLVKIPPMVTETPSIFQMVHVDMLHMTPPLSSLIGM
jgi:hypothetical protein